MFNAAHQTPALLGLLACVFSLACSSPPDSGASNTAPGDPSVLAGTFQVRLVPPAPGVGGSPDTPGYTDVRGKVYSGPSPSYIVWELSKKAGDCQLLLPRVPFCSTPCGGAAACVEDDTCHVSIDISHHGGIKGIIECDAEDTGSLELSAALLTELLNLGVAGFPTIHISRRFVGSTTIAPGRVELAVVSDVLIPVEIPGLTSCNDDSSCPNGQTCQADETCK
jgi:hypothetical protein